MTLDILLINTHESTDENLFSVQLEKAINVFDSTITLASAYHFGNIKKFCDDKYSHIILSGVPLDGRSLTDNKFNLEIQSKYNYLLEINTPVLGICFGHQILASLYGLEIKSLSKPIDSFAKSEFKENLIYVSGINSWYKDEIYVHHRDFVNTNKFVPGVNVLLECNVKENTGGSNLVPYIIEYDKKRPVIGYQFHPEFSGSLGRVLFQNFFMDSMSIK